MLGNLVTVKSFAAEEREIGNYEEALARAARAHATLGVGLGIFSGLSSLATNGNLNTGL